MSHVSPTTFPESSATDKNIPWETSKCSSSDKSMWLENTEWKMVPEGIRFENHLKRKLSQAGHLYLSIHLYSWNAVCRAVCVVSLPEAVVQLGSVGGGCIHTR